MCIRDRHETARFLSDRTLKRLVQLRPDNEHHPFKAHPVRVVNRIIQNDLPARADRIDLLESAVARPHARGHDHQNRFLHRLLPLP